MTATKQRVRECAVCLKRNETVRWREGWRPKSTFVCDGCFEKGRPVKAATVAEADARYRLRRAERRWPRSSWPVACIGEPMACPAGGCERCLL